MAKQKNKIKARRVWLTPAADTMSYIANIPYDYDSNGFSIQMADCNRQITWEFSKKSKRDKAKIAKIKREIDHAYNFMWYDDE